MTGLAPLSANPAKFVHLSVEQGLSQSSVQAVVQDHTGFMWFGTDEGLNRFDGYRFVVFKHDDKRADSLPDDSISALFEDSRQRLWIGTQHGLCRFDETTLGFKPIDQIHDRITGIVESADGTLWMASQGGGHFLLPPGESSFVSYVPDARYPWDSLSSYSLSAIYLDHQGRLWLGSRDHGVDRFVPGKPYGKFIHYRHGERDPASLSSNDVWGITENARGQIMVATYGAGLNLLDEKTSTFQKVRAPAAALPAANRLTAAFHDRAGAVWLGSDGAGLLRYDAQTGGLASAGGAEAESDPLHQTVVRSLYEDRQGHLWFGTYQMGVNQLKVPRRDFGYYTHEAADPASLSDPSVASVLQDRAGRIWVGTERGGLDQFDPVTGKFIRHRFPAPASSVPAIMSLHQDQEGRLWAGTYGEGLARFDPVSGNFTHFGKEAGLANQEVWTMADGPHGTLWLGTDGGLDQFDPQLGKVVSHFGPGSGGNLGDLSVRSLRTDAEGTLWVGSFGGLTALPSGAKELRHFQHDPRDPDSLSNDIVVAIYPDSRENVWVGTLGGGMEKLNRANGRFTRFQNFPSHAINAIEADLQGKLWLSTNHGLVRFDPATGTASSFDLTNGLQSLQFHLGAGGHLRDGRLMFGSVDGLYLFDPAQIKPDRFAPPLVITAVKVLNKPVALRPASAAASAVVLPAADKLLSVEFAALDYSLPRRNQYAYRLEGLTGEWIELHDQREVSFTNLAAGSYLLRLRASNSDGVWSDASVASLAVTVLPPFWATWWFRGAVAAAVFGLFWGAHGLRVSSLRHALAVRKESEQVLRRAEEKYRELVEDIGDVIFSTNESGLVTYISPVVEGILGFAPAEIIGQSFAVLIGEGGLAQILQELKRPAHRARAF